MQRPLLRRIHDSIDPIKIKARWCVCWNAKTNFIGGGAERCPSRLNSLVRAGTENKG
jgi:hypothetical protein